LVTGGDIETPLSNTSELYLKDKLALFPILRSGLMISQAIEDLLPVSLVGTLGIRRNRRTLIPEVYYSNMPRDLSGYVCYILDPMLATGKIMCTAIDVLQERNATNITAVAIIATKQGITTIFNKCPNTKIITCHIDPILDSSGYIIPGLGDVGDRAFGADDNAHLTMNMGN
jgi:uracil phosphoribosyltransferase